MSTDRAFQDAAKTVHSVTTQWHHSVMTAHGFVPETLEAMGFVRSYDYTHPAGHRIRCNTGYSADYWQHLDALTKKCGYWSELEPYVRSLVAVKSADG